MDAARTPVVADVLATPALIHAGGDCAHARGDDNCSALWRCVARADFLAVLRSEAAAALLGPLDAEEHALLTPALFDRESLVHLFRERILRLLDRPAQHPACGRCVVSSAVAVAASCLQLWVQDNVTGPELDGAVGLDASHPLPYAASILEREGSSTGGEEDRGAAGGAATHERSRAARLNAERIRQWQVQDASTSSAGEGGEEDGEEGAACGGPSPPPTPGGGAALSGVHSLLHRYSLAALASSGEDAYEFSSHPHWLVTSRGVLEAVTRPVPAGGQDPPATPKDDAARVEEAEEEEEDDPFPVLSLEARDPRLSALWSLTDGMPGVCWWAGRAAVMHQRALVDRTANDELLRTAHARFACAASVLCPDLQPAFSCTDAFQPWMVADVLEGVGLVGEERRGAGQGGGAEEEEEMTRTLPPIPRDGGAREVVAALLLEWGVAQHWFDHTDGAKTAFLLAKRESGLATQLTGALGKRTKFQLHDTAQLVLRAASSDVQAVRLGDVDGETHVMEKAVLRSDGGARRTQAEEEARDRDFSPRAWGKQFERVVVEGGGGVGGVSSLPPPLTDGPLSILDQAITLALCLDIKNHNPVDGLTSEEMRPYVERTLDTPLHWMVHSTGLLIRSRLEGDAHRTAERAVLQLQALVDQHTNRLTAMQATSKSVASSAPASHRLSHVHALPFPTKWALRREAGERYLKLGAARAALALFQELGLWDEIIDCCISLDKPRRAERLIVARLSVHPSPRLWCCLGLIRDADEHYETAWEVSRNRFAKAQLMLGRRKFQRGDSEGARVHLHAGLSLSPHVEGEWFLLGVIAMKGGDMHAAVDAFSRVVQLDPTRADAWANLGSIYLHQQRWERGYAALEQATKADKRDFRIWSNYLVACIRTRSYARAMFVLWVLLDLYVQLGRGREAGTGGEGVDLPALAALTGEVLASLREEGQGVHPHSRQHTDGSGNAARVHLEPLARLFDRITQVVTSQPRVWELYAQLQGARGLGEEELECRLRECRALQGAGWERSAPAVKALVRAAGHVVAGYARAGDATSLTAARLFVEGILARLDLVGEAGGVEGVADLRAQAVRLGVDQPPRV